ncbi:MAG: hypothetical protein HOD91_01410 [Candidatus Marinimicrobia bacterium]|nr:hypothetical protein [Candidatus Neomarinimicrobiota bacterium]
MKRTILLTALLAFMACEDKKDDEGSLVGTWELSNSGKYANSNCSGDLDYSGWAFLVNFGVKGEMTFKSDGTGTFTISFGTEKEEVPITWDENKTQICLMGVECLPYKLDGDKFTLDQAQDAYCENYDGEETSHESQSTCEAAGNSWEEASCIQMEFTKK